MTTGLLDASVVVDWHDPTVVTALPVELAVSAVTAAELAAGPHLAHTPREAARRQARLQEVEATSEPIRFDGAAVRSHGLAVAAVVHEGRKARSRFADLLIAATAHANGLDPCTRNGRDFEGTCGVVPTALDVRNDAFRWWPGRDRPRIVPRTRRVLSQCDGEVAYRAHLGRFRGE